MREMVLNHASLQAPDHYSAVDWLKDVTSGMTLLILHRVAESTLRMSRLPHEIHCMPAWSLLDALLELRRVGSLEEYLFIMRLSTKVPLLSDVDQNVVDRFLGCEAKGLHPEDGAPLVLCAITDGIAVGFPSAGWDRDQLTISFNEMIEDESIGEATETIDNLTRSAHARTICERYRAGLPQPKNGADLWENREKRFPHLVFGPEVGGQLSALNTAVLQTVVNKLASLDDSAAAWRDSRDTIPTWLCKVTPESDSVMNNERLREARRFRSHYGTRELFEWHARFGSGGRIHLRFDPRTFEVEIGYIGDHLPTARFRN